MVSLVGGREWMVEAHACESSSLGDLERVRDLFGRMIQELGLHPVAEPQWHKFSGEGGITGLALLAESHITCHTFPEFGSLCLNLFCCRPRRRWDFEGALREIFGAGAVTVREVERPFHG